MLPDISLAYLECGQLGGPKGEKQDVVLTQPSCGIAKYAPVGRARKGRPRTGRRLGEEQ